MIPDVRILHVRASGRSPLLAFKPYVNNQRNKNKASTDSTFVLKSADFQQASRPTAIKLRDYFNNFSIFSNLCFSEKSF